MPPDLWHGQPAQTEAGEKNAKGCTHAPLEVFVHDDNGVGVVEPHPHSFAQIQVQMTRNLGKVYS